MGIYFVGAINVLRLSYFRNRRVRDLIIAERLKLCFF
jgi:hypothetical protein